MNKVFNFLIHVKKKNEIKKLQLNLNEKQDENDKLKVNFIFLLFINNFY